MSRNIGDHASIWVERRWDWEILAITHASHLYFWHERCLPSFWIHDCYLMMWELSRACLIILSSTQRNVEFHEVHEWHEFPVLCWTRYGWRGECTTVIPIECMSSMRRGTWYVWKMGKMLSLFLSSDICWCRSPHHVSFEKTGPQNVLLKGSKIDCWLIWE